MQELPRFGSLTPSQLDSAALGAKGAWLHWLAWLGLDVPVGVVLTVERLAAEEPERLAERVLGELGDREALAVRASPVRSQPGVLPSAMPVQANEVQAALVQLREAARRAHTGCAAVAQRFVAAGDDGWAAAVFTRDPTRGTRGVTGAWSPAGSGQDVVGGTKRLPAIASGRGSLRAERPQQFAELEALAARVEQATGRVMELEVVHDGERLWAVQARPVARRPAAAVRLALERAEASTDHWLDLHPSDAEGLWVERVSAGRLADARGIAASPGVVSGHPETDPARAERRAAAGESVILLRAHAAPEDVPAVRAAAGVLTSSGGLTCHAAVMARGLGKPAVVSCTSLDLSSRPPSLAGRPLAEIETLTLDGHSGSVYVGPCETVRVPSGAPLERLLAVLASRRAVQLWVCGLPDVLAVDAQRLSVDGVLVADGAKLDVGELPVWERDPGGARVRRRGREEIVHVCVGDGEETVDDGAAGRVWVTESAPPEGALPTGLTAVAADFEQLLPWAFALDPVLRTEAHGPDREGLVGRR